MHTVLFIHGTGVRDPAFTTSFNLVQQALNRRLGAPNVRVEPCYWGGTCGSELLLGGAAIPNFDSTRAVGGNESDSVDYLLALWALLYDDASAELDLLALREPGGETPPGHEPPGADLDQLARKLSAETADLQPERRQELADLLTSAGLMPYLEEARTDIIAHPSYNRAVTAAVEPLTDYRFAIARAILARSIQKYREVQDAPDGYLSLNSTSRDRIVELLVAALGGKEAGAVDWVKERAGWLVKGVGTRWTGRRRGRVSEQFAPFGADIIVYQTRPQAIRGFIRNAVAQASNAGKIRGENGEVVVIAHSLGGIAAVDTLIEQPLEVVRHLVTVGSQAPLLYELDALGSLPILRDAAGKVVPLPHPLPDHFPKSWLNVYDPRDFLSYRGQTVFGQARVTDIELDNGQPFPESHSAYWTNEILWAAITSRLSGGD
jgi:hypothetical protein